MPLPLIAAGVAGILVESLPSIASWIFGDKTGKAVETVTGIARDVLGTDNPADIERAIAADPEKALQFKLALIEAEATASRHAAEMRQKDIDELKARFDDVAGARSQTVELAKAGSPIAYGPVVVSILVTLAFMLALWFVVRQEIPLASREIAYILLGTLAAKFGDIVAYWVGSSSGSASKDAALRQAAIGKG